MRTLFIVPLLLLSLITSAQTKNQIPPGGYPYRQEQIPKSGWMSDSLRQLRISQSTLTSTQNGILTNLAGKINAVDVYPKSISDNKYKPIGYVPSYAEIVGKPTTFPSAVSTVAGLPDSLNKKLNVSAFQAAFSNVANTTTTFNKNETLGLLETKADATALTNIANNTYSKTQVESLDVAANAVAIAKKGGFTMLGDSTTDNTAALRYVMANPGPNGARFLPPGNWAVTGSLDIYTGKFFMAPGATLVVKGNFAPESIGGNDGRYVIRVRGPDVIIESLNINCNGYQAAPIAVYFAPRVTIRGCTLRNWRMGGLGQHGILLAASNDGRVLYNNLINGDYAINTYASGNVLVEGNFVQYMVHGGIYNVFTENYTAAHNHIFDCGDNGIDSEGGRFNTWHHNTVGRCQNGEVNIFDGGAGPPYTMHDLVFEQNNLTREAQYGTMNAAGTVVTMAACNPSFGAISVMSLGPNCYNIIARDNIVTVRYGVGIYHGILPDKADRDVLMLRNQITAYPGASGFYRVLNGDGLTFEANILTGKAGTENQINEFRDVHNGRYSRNIHRFDLPKISNPAVLINTSGNYATKGIMIDHNVFENCNSLALQYDPFQNGSLIATIWANDFGPAFVVNGGLTISANGSARLRNQTLQIALVDGLNDINNMPGLSYDRLGGGYVASGYIAFGRAAYNGTYATYHVMGGSGHAVTQGVSAPNLNISISGPSINLNNTTGSVVGGRLHVTVDSY